MSIPHPPTYPPTHPTLLALATGLRQRQPFQGNGGQAHVQFVDDADENGVTPQRAVPIIHIIKLPLGS